MLSDYSVLGLLVSGHRVSFAFEVDLCGVLISKKIVKDL